MIVSQLVVIGDGIISGRPGISPDLVLLQQFRLKPWTAGTPDVCRPSQHGSPVAFPTQDVVCRSEVTVVVSFTLEARKNEREDGTL